MEPGCRGQSVRVLARSVIARGWLGVGQEPEHHGPGAGRRIPGLPLVTADQLLLVGDEPGGFLPGERERGTSGHPGPAAPVAHVLAGGAEPLEALQVIGPERLPQPGYLRLSLHAKPLARDPHRFRRDLPPPFPALPAPGDLAHEVVLGQQSQVVAHNPAVLAQVPGQRGGGSRPGLAHAPQDPLPHRVRQCPEFLDIPHLAGLQWFGHDARIIMHGFLCKYYWARLFYATAPTVDPA